MKAKIFHAIFGLFLPVPLLVISIWVYSSVIFSGVETTDPFSYHNPLNGLILSYFLMGGVLLLPIELVINRHRSKKLLIYFFLPYIFSSIFVSYYFINALSSGGSAVFKLL